jgi:hypothetical protein
MYSQIFGQPEMAQATKIGGTSTIVNCKYFSVSAFHHQSISTTLHLVQIKAHYCISAPLVLKSTSINQGNIYRVHPPHCGVTNRTFPLKTYALPSCLPEAPWSWRPNSKAQGLDHVPSKLSCAQIVLEYCDTSWMLIKCLEYVPISLFQGGLHAEKKLQYIYAFALVCSELTTLYLYGDRFWEIFHVHSSFCSFTQSAE